VSRVVAAHQPTFLPWLGLFDKLHRADVFVLLDDVQAPQTGAGSWINRVRMLVGGQVRWVTVPVHRHGRQDVREVRIDDGQPWRARMLRTIEHAYRRAGHYEAGSPLVEEFVSAPESLVAAFNERNLRRLMDVLRLDGTTLVRSSELGVTGRGTELLIGLTKAAGGTTYLSGDGSQGYLEEERFAGSAVELAYQRYEHPVYLQRSRRFVPGLSVVDALLHCGIEATRELIVR
jgi:WbqC-like protein family